MDTLYYVYKSGLVRGPCSVSTRLQLTEYNKIYFIRVGAEGKRKLNIGSKLNMIGNDYSIIFKYSPTDRYINR